MNQMRLPRVLFLMLALLAFLTALWAGWVRLGWPWPVLLTYLPRSHGPLMVSGFLGSLVSLERAVALQKRWAYLGPAFSALGALGLALGIPTLVGATLIALGSAWLVIMFIVILRKHFAFYTLAMALGSAAWLTGNLLWVSGRLIFMIVLWWVAFLVLTIAGERLELGRIAHLSKTVESLFLAAASLLFIGLVLSVFWLDLGTRLASLGMLGISFWLLRFDIARKTIRQHGLPRFAATCLLTGFFWLGVGGALGMIDGAQPGGPRYDAFLHAVFLGFIMSMVFGHAPIIFPAILSLPITFTPLFYLPLALLNLSLLMRITGDLALAWPLRLWGGLLNGIAILLFLTMAARSMRRSKAAGAMLAGQ